MNPTRAYKPLSVFGVSLVCAALLGGCANTEAVGKAQTTADQALQKANEASTEAAQAMKTAQEAKASADQANATANAAKAESEKAMQEVNALSEKVDRMFKKTMQK